MPARRFKSLASSLAVLVAAVIATTGSGVLPGRSSETVDDVAQLMGAVFAAGSFAVTGIRSSGPERRWRLLVAGAMTSWGTGQTVWTVYRATGNDIPSPSLADVGYLGLFVFMLPALLVIARQESGAARPEPPTTAASRSRAVLVIDGLVVVGSLFTLTWSTALGAAVRGGGSSAVGFAVAVAYPITDLILVVILVLLATVQRITWRPCLLLVGLGLVALSVSDSLFTWLVSVGAEEINPLFDAGFVAGPVLIALGALAPPADPESAGGGRSAISASAHLLIPYLPLLTVGLVVVIKTAVGSGADPLQTYIGVVVVGLVVLRQLVTLRENNALLRQVGETQRELTYQAFHDPLTGLANRSLFGDRLTRAVAAHHRSGDPVALLFCDLDDFKIINDTLGHAAGDELLREVGRRLSKCTRVTDTVARLGGDEFAVLLQGEMDVHRFIAQRLLPALQPPYLLLGTTWEVGTSIGMAAAAAGSSELDSEALLHHADTAMYAVKRHGGGRIGSYTSRGVDILPADALYVAT